MPVQATIHHGTLPLIVTGPVTSRGARGALDSVNFEVLAAPAWEDDLDDLGFEYDQPVPGFHSMWVQSITSEPENDRATLVSINCIGLLKAGEKRRRRVTVNGREIAVGPIEETILAWVSDEQGETPDGEPVAEVKRRVPELDDEGEPVYKSIVTGSGTAERWNVRDVVLVVADTYFTTTQPVTSVIGTNQTPPDAPTPPSYIWGGYDEAMRFNAPNGWVLDDRQIEAHFDTGTAGLWEVTDVYGYYQTGSPD